jgi:phytoene synthase
MTPELAESYAAAERTTAEWAKSFYFASRFLPRPKRLAVFALYDYCRHADNLVDLRGERSAAAVRAELGRLAAMVRAVDAGAAPGDARWAALADTMRRYPVPVAPLLELLDGVAMDLEPVRFADWPSLERYCRLVAGGVGLMLGPVLGASSDRFDRLGVGLGVAMQLTNVLRDVAEDLDQGRCYLPQEELATFGVRPRALEARHATPELRRLVRFQVERARRLFAEADPVVELFPRDGSRLTVRLLQRTYAGILDGIARQGYDPFRGRAYVSGPRKLAILGRAVLGEWSRPAFLFTEQSA